MGCTVTTNRHGVLTFRIFWQGGEYWRSTGRKDTPEDRHYVEALAEVIGDAIEKKTFSLDWFEDEAKQQKPDSKTVGSYYLEWIERKKPPVVRAGLARDYRDHFNRYMLGKFKNVALVDVTPRRLEEFRAYLLSERGLSLKSCRNVIDASFRAMIRDARKIDGHIKEDPFTAIDWPRLPVQKPDPFTEEERDKIIQHFREKNRFYYPFVYTLFWTGMRPSEALTLRWEDIDLKHGFISISKSHYLEESS